MAAYFKPTSLTAAVEALSDGSWTLLAGGTDVFPAKAGEAAWGRQRDDAVIDLSGLSELAGISRDAAGIRIGAGVTWSDLLAADLPADFAALRAAAREVGGRQIQNRGTLVGNICNASPAAARWSSCSTR